jgi:membrane protein YdbS with pleckstrin-like domain
VEETEEAWLSKLGGRQGLGIRWEEGNRIIWRKHWMALLPRIGWVWLTPLFVIMVAFGYWALTTEQVPDELTPVASALQWFLVLFVLAFLLRLTWVIVDWYNDTYEVSDTEVLNIRKLPFGLREDRRAAPLPRIQNVEMRIPSPIHWWLDYGNVVIQTAAEFGALIFYSVPNPRAVADEILSRMEKAQKRQEEDEARRRAQDLPDWFEMYNRLEQRSTVVQGAAGAQGQGQAQGQAQDEGQGVTSQNSNGRSAASAAWPPASGSA